MSQSAPISYFPLLTLTGTSRRHQIWTETSSCQRAPEVASQNWSSMQVRFGARESGPGCAILYPFRKCGRPVQALELGSDWRPLTGPVKSYMVCQSSCSACLASLGQSLIRTGGRSEQNETDGDEDYSNVHK